jgi:DNA repair protein RadA/Sms
VGLSGELRPVAQTAERLSEAAQLGFARVIMPKARGRAGEWPQGLEVRAVATLSEALAQAGLSNQ